jgi:hypothetical protein
MLELALHRSSQIYMAYLSLELRVRRSRMRIVQWLLVSWCNRQGPPGLCTPKTPKVHPKLQPSLCVHNQFSFLRLV